MSKNVFLAIKIACLFAGLGRELGGRRERPQLLAPAQKTTASAVRQARQGNVAGTE